MAAPYFSELKYLGGASLDFVEVVVDAGTDVSNISVIIYHPSGAVRSTNALGSVTDTVAGQDVYLLDTATSPTFTGLHANGGAALVVDGVVTHFYSFTGPLTATGGPASGMTSTAIGTTGSGESLESTDGINYSVQSTPTGGSVPCFLSGTMILTAQGQKPVEALRAGDLIVTKDDGVQELLWQGGFDVDRQSIEPMKAAPIVISKGALGAGLPDRDLAVSPNHCMMMSQTICELLFGEPEVLVAAKFLVDLPGFRRVKPRKTIRYHHLLFASHQIIYANGVATESLNPRAQSIVTMSSRNRLAIRWALARAPMGRAWTARIKLRQFEATAMMSARQDMQLARAA